MWKIVRKHEQHQWEPLLALENRDRLRKDVENFL